MRAFESARAVLELCKIEECGEQGVKLVEDASLTLRRYVLR